MENIQKINFYIPELNSMKQYPKDLYYIGNLNLLKKRKIAVVGSRHPSQYAINATYQIVNKLSQAGYVIVSGGAIGIDTIAHKASIENNTIMVSGTGLDIRYPSINKRLICEIEQKGLVLSQFASKTVFLPRNFAIRNELIVALGDILIVSYADIKSGSMRSIEYALKMGKEIYVLPHKIGESEGTNTLLVNKKAKAIFNIEKFVSEFAQNNSYEKPKDEFLHFCKDSPSIEKAIYLFGDKIFEYELKGLIYIKKGKVFLN